MSLENTLQILNELNKFYCQSNEGLLLLLEESKESFTKGEITEEELREIMSKIIPKFQT